MDNPMNPRVQRIINNLLPAANLEGRFFPPQPIFPISGVDFFTKVLNLSISFEKNELGKVTSFTLSQEGNQVKVEKPVGSGTSSQLIQR
jgi:hypothetical protein